MVPDRKAVVCVIALLSLFGLAGCRKGNIVQVNGVLFYKGKPVPHATIHFEPEQGRMSWAQTDEEGRFKVNYDAHQDGAVVGKHKVWMEKRPITNKEKEAALIGGFQPLAGGELAEFYDKYGGDKSKLTVEITHDTRELRLDLK